MKRRFFCAILSFLTLPASFAFDGADLTSIDSTAVISGSTQSATRYVLIRISKAQGDSQPGLLEDAEEVNVPIQNASFSEKIYLRNGPGVYSVTIWETANPTPDNAPFTLVGTDTILNKDTADHLFLLPAQNIQSDDLEITALSAQITGPAQDTLKKARSIHDWVSTHIVYDEKSYFSGGDSVTNALDALNAKSAMCEGYALLTAALNRAAGIPTKVISGQGLGGRGWEDHQWDEFLADGKWISEDTTWDAGVTDMRKKIFIPKLIETYFNPNPARFKQTHLRESEENE